MQKGKDPTESTSVLKHDSCSLILVIYILCYILGRVFFFYALLRECGVSLTLTGSFSLKLHCEGQE